jgi:N-acyl-D-amino-acid deacylase
MVGKYDLVIVNGRIIDGSGNPWYKANIGIQDGKISVITKSKINGEIEIDASGLVITPGFIDIHSHSDMGLRNIIYNKATNRVMQGITTEAVGNCGSSAYGWTKKYAEKYEERLKKFGLEYKINWTRLSEWKKKVEERGYAINIAPFVGFGTIRTSVLGEEGEGGERSDIGESELNEMKKLLREAMEDGAFGMTAGLEYDVQRNAYTEELIEMCKVIAEYHGLFMAHIRSEDEMLIEAVKEFIRICREAGVSGCISHHKACHPNSWGKPYETIRLIREARMSGIDVICDQYPWLKVAVLNVGEFFRTEGEEEISSKEREKILEYMKDDEKWRKMKEEAIKRNQMEEEYIERKKRELAKKGTPFRMPWNPTTYFVIAHSKTHPEYVDKNFTEVAKLMGVEDPWEAMRKLYIMDNGETTVAEGYMREEDVIEIMKAPFTAISTDGGTEDEPKALHPRNYGTYPQFLGYYVRERKVVELEEAIRKITSLPARFLNLKDRGLLREGYWADIVIFDEREIANLATYEKPCTYPKGIKYVIVNGEIVVENGKHTGKLPGKVLKYTR